MALGYRQEHLACVIVDFELNLLMKSIVKDNLMKAEAHKI